MGKGGEEGEKERGKRKGKGWEGGKERVPPF